MKEFGEQIVWKRICDHIDQAIQHIAQTKTGENKWRAFVEWVKNIPNEDFQTYFKNLPQDIVSRAVWIRPEDAHLSDGTISSSVTSAHINPHLTSSQEESLSNHLDQMDLSSSTPQGYYGDHKDTWHKEFKNPGMIEEPLDVDLFKELRKIHSNYKMHHTFWPKLMSITPGDFLPNGRFAHIYIPKY